MDDLDAICVLGQEVNRPHHEHWPALFAPPSSPRRDRALWRPFLGSADSIAFVAQGGSGVVGFITASIHDTDNTLLEPVRFCRIGSVCVVESERGRGIGRELIALVERWAVEKGAVDIRLNVWKFNTGAMCLYEELGYAERSVNFGKPLL